MTNNAYHKLRHEFNLNYNYQNNFREYCDNIGIMKKGFYGNSEARTEDMKAARDYWKKNHKLWFKNIEEVDVYTETDLYSKEFNCIQGAVIGVVMASMFILALFV